MKPLTVAALAWFVALWLLFIFATPLKEYLFLFYLPVHWGIFAVGCVLAVIACATFRKNGERSVAVLFLCLIGFVLFFSVGFDCGRYVLFQIRKSSYEEQLSQARELGHVPDQLGHTDNGPPTLFAFYWQRGVVDNWSGVVYDPSGRIAEINNAVGWDEVHEHELSRLFGGTYYRCQKVGGGWYICWFT